MEAIWKGALRLRSHIIPYPIGTYPGLPATESLGVFYKHAANMHKRCLINKNIGVIVILSFDLDYNYHIIKQLQNSYLKRRVCMITDILQ